jgi:hypothetical protein
MLDVPLSFRPDVSAVHLFPALLMDVLVLSIVRVSWMCLTIAKAL